MAQEQQHRQTRPGDEPGRGGDAGVPVPQEHIAVAAYYNAERRGFAAGADVDDWLEAERFLVERRRQPGADGAGEARGLDHPARDANGAPAADVIEPDQVAQWADVLRVSPEELRVALQRSGPRVEDVKAFLANAH